jgi:GNAT superfamily N-acetyltransferase
MTTIRRFAQDDAVSVRALINEIMGREFSEDRAAYPTEDIDQIERTYGGIGEAFFVAVNGQDVIGTVAVKKEDDRVALLRRLFVLSDYRNRQIGRKLVDRALKFCDEMGYREIVFRTTSRMTAAAKLCEKCGFVKRAQLQLGSVELYKFSLSLRKGRNGAKAS